MARRPSIALVLAVATVLALAGCAAATWSG